MTKALLDAQRPGVPALRPSDWTMSNSVITYSFGAALLGMLETYWDATASGTFQVMFQLCRQAGSLACLHSMHAVSLSSPQVNFHFGSAQ